MFLLSSRCKHRYLRGGGNSFPKNWRVNYTNQGYVEIPKWSGVVGDVVEMNLVYDGGGWQYLLDSRGSGGKMYVGVNGGGHLEYYGVTSTLTPDDKPLVIGKQYGLHLRLSQDDRIPRIGTNFSKTEAFNGSITNIRFTNQDGSDNRFYESIIKSATQPDTLELVDSISGKNGTLVNFPVGQEWTDTYNLGNGLWDMSRRELVSFTRSTKAWLDGVEYAIDEPRYKNGELLVEAQATNFWDVGNVMLQGADYTSREKINVLGRYEITRVTIIGSGSKISAWGTIPDSKFLIFVYKKDAAISGFKDSNLRSGVNFKLDNNQLPVADESVIGYTEYSDYVEVRLINLKPTTDPANFCIVVAESHEVATLTSAEYGIVSLSDTSTLFIPTTTTAVTRAADIATVRDKS